MENWKERLKKEMGVYIKESSKYGYDMLVPNYVVENFIYQELAKARKEGEIEVLKDMQKVWDNDNLGDAPKYGSAGAGLMKRWIRDDINERLSKLTTK